MKTPILAIFAVIAFTAVGQEDSAKPKTAYEKFMSNKGVMVEKDFYNLPSLITKYKSIDAKVIHVDAGGKTGIFLGLTATDKYRDKTATISQDDLTEIIKAFAEISAYAEKEKTVNLSYRERFFETNDGFKVGYFQSETNQTLFVELDNYQSDDTYFPISFELLGMFFNKADSVIKEHGGQSNNL